MWKKREREREQSIRTEGKQNEQREKVHNIGAEGVEKKCVKREREREQRERRVKMREHRESTERAQREHREIKERSKRDQEKNKERPREEQKCVERERGREREWRGGNTERERACAGPLLITHGKSQR